MNLKKGDKIVSNKNTYLIYMGKNIRKGMVLYFMNNRSSGLLSFINPGGYPYLINMYEQELQHFDTKIEMAKKVISEYVER